MLKDALALSTRVCKVAGSFVVHTGAGAAMVKRVCPTRNLDEGDGMNNEIFLIGETWNEIDGSRKANWFHHGKPRTYYNKGLFA